MSEDPPKYSDTGEQVDYQVIKSYGRASRPIVRNNLYIIGIVIIVLICLITIFQTVKIRETWEKRVTESEKRVTELEKRVTQLETKLIKLESQRAR
jgi:tetrahydromethanopterin S-methyltransferase subunit G